MASRPNTGVTLLEMLICLSIIAVLALIAAPLLTSRHSTVAVTRSEEQVRQQAAREARTIPVVDGTDSAAALRAAIEPTGRRLRPRVVRP